MKKKILLIYTGGTIGMTKDYKTGSLVPFDFDSIFNNIPELQLLDVDLQSISFEKVIDSSDINEKHWIKIAEIIENNYLFFDGFVVLHGTDTMAYSASALSFMLNGLQKPVIFTGSQLPIGDLRTDSKENLITSIYFAIQHKNKIPIIQEVCIYFEYKLFRANRTTKYSTLHFDAYVSPNFPLLGEAGVHLNINENELYFDKMKTFNINTAFKNEIEIFKYYPNCSYSILKYLVNNEQVRVIILECFGAGNIPLDEENLELLRISKQKNKLLIVTSQCIAGKIDLGKYQNSNIFLELDAIDGKDMTQECLITKAMFLLGQNSNNKDFKQYFEQNLKGELS